MTEASDSFACFGGTCAVHVGGDAAREAVVAARRSLLAWHDRFTRFDPDSELSRLNADPREVVRVTPLMARLAAGVAYAAELSGGLVDGTLLAELEAAGYRDDPLDLATALRLAPARRPASARRPPAIEVDFGALTVRRPPGTRIDGGGLAKGLFADVLAETLRERPSFAIDCAGDLRIGGTARRVQVTSPFDGRILHRWQLCDVGVATSGIGRRSWLDRGRPAHHLLDPGTGRPAFTGVVQATAIAPTALEAEVRAKAAVLSGPEGATAWLPYGGLVVLDDGSHHKPGTAEFKLRLAPR